MSLLAVALVAEPVPGFMGQSQKPPEGCRFIEEYLFGFRSVHAGTRKVEGVQVDLYAKGSKQPNQSVDVEGVVHLSGLNLRLLLAVYTVMADIIVVPVVGMGTTGITMLGRTPYTIIEVIDRKTLRIQEDQAFRTGSGRVEAQEYRYEANLRGAIKTIVMNDRGLWFEKGVDTRKNFPYIVGVRRKYHDYSTALSNLWKSNRA